ncbi:MAG: hypothetical protein WAL75_23950, partial [Terracidiphilus sp.]
LPTRRGMKLCPIHRTFLFLSDGWESAELILCFVVLAFLFLISRAVKSRKENAWPLGPEGRG